LSLWSFSASPIPTISTIWADVPDPPIAGLAPIAVNVNIVMQAAPAEFVRRRKQQNRSTIPHPSNPSSIPNNVMPPLRKVPVAGAWPGRMDIAGSMEGSENTPILDWLSMRKKIRII
jgi:hypothetical protein